MTLVVLPALVLMVLALPLMCSLTEPFFTDFIFSSVTIEFSHFIDNSYPPRARMPVTEPLLHTLGSAGSSVMMFPSLCTSISHTPAVPPKLPSIWDGGWASKRLGYVPPERRLSSPL